MSSQSFQEESKLNKKVLLMLNVSIMLWDASILLMYNIQ